MTALLNYYYNLTDPVKYMFDGLSITTIVAAFLKLMPAAGATLTVIWLGLRIYETSLNIRQAKKNLTKD